MRLLLLFVFFFNFHSILGQNIIFNNENDSDLLNKLTLEISTEKDTFEFEEAIVVNYSIKNISEEEHKILLKEYWGFPMGMAASIIDSNDSSICKYPSRHILSSQIFTSDQLKDDYKSLEPGESVRGKVILQEIPVFKESVLQKIPSGEYTFQLWFRFLQSNQLKVIVKEQRH